ncbi:MAG: hypothetical protein R3221_01460, partial [Spongiibacter sp.]|nr:hypothetical protein [Spongiibacter sp.]
EGVIVKAGQSVMQLVETGQIEAIFGVPGELGRELVLGQSLPVYSKLGQWQAQVLAVSENLDWRTQTRSIRVELPESTPLVDGETIHLVLHEKRQQPGIWLPMEALLEDVRGSWAVYQVSADAKGKRTLVKRSVQPLYQHKGRVYVDAEVTDGAQVVSAGIHRLAPGQEVVLFNDTAERRVEIE